MIECGLVKLGLPVLLHVPPRLLARLLLLLLHLQAGQTALVAEIVLPRDLAQVVVSGGLIGVHEVPDVVEFQGTVDDGRGPHV